MLLCVQNLYLATETKMKKTQYHSIKTYVFYRRGTMPYFVCNLVKSFVEIFFHAWHFHNTWYFVRHGTSTIRVNSTRHDISMRQTARSTSHADALLISIRDLSNVAIELCNMCFLKQPSIKVNSCHMQGMRFIA